MIKGNQPAATSGLASNITTKFATNVHIDETEATGGDWADDDVQMEADEDGVNRDNSNGNPDEQGEGWGDSEIELPADLVSHRRSSVNQFVLVFLGDHWCERWSWGRR